MSKPKPPPSLNSYIEDLKLTARSSMARAEKAEFDLAKAEACVRNLDRQRATEKARADRAEAALMSLGMRGAA